jgi:hypothetical protein
LLIGNPIYLQRGHASDVEPPMRAVSLMILFAVTLAAGWLLYGTLHPAHAFFLG